jgi:hypothetical protein
MSPYDPLGIYGGMPLVPPWAVQFGLHPPYPGGSFDEYLDPSSRFYRPDVVTALMTVRRQEAEAEQARRRVEEDEAAEHRRHREAALAARDPLERAAELVQLRSLSSVSDLLWDTWQRLREAGIARPTHDLVRLDIKAPLIRPRFSELERRGAWSHAVQELYVDEQAEVWAAAAGQPVPRRAEPWFVVGRGAAVQAHVGSTRQSGLRFTAIRGTPLQRAAVTWHDGAIWGVLKRIVDDRATSV